MNFNGLLRKSFNGLYVDTVSGLVNINTILPPLASAVLVGPVSPIIVGAGAVAWNLIPLIRDKQKEARKLLKEPAAFLMRVEENLAPATFSSWLRQSARRFVLAV